MNYGHPWFCLPKLFDQGSTCESSLNYMYHVTLHGCLYRY